MNPTKPFIPRTFSEVNALVVRRELARIAIALEVSPGALIPAPFKAETGQAS